MIVLYNICWMVFDFLDGKYIRIIISSLSGTIVLVSLILQVFSIVCLFLFVCVMVRHRTRTNHLQLKLFLLGAIAVLSSVFSTTLFIIGVINYLSALTCIPGINCVLIIIITYFVNICISHSSDNIVLSTRDMVLL